MVSFRNVEWDDEARILEFLAQENNQSPEVYRGLFRLPATFKENAIGPHANLGSVLIGENDSIIGYIGSLPGRVDHTISGDSQAIRHMTHWTVRPTARAYSLKLLKHFLENGAGPVLNHSANLAVQQLLPKFGFRQIDEAELTYNTLPLLFRFPFSRFRILSSAQLQANLSEFERQRFSDHARIGCPLVGIADTESSTIHGLIILLKQLRYRAHAQVVGITDDNLFKQNPDALCLLGRHLFARYRVSRLTIDQRFAPKRMRAHSVKERHMFIYGEWPGVAHSDRSYGEPLHRYGRFD